MTITPRPTWFATALEVAAAIVVAVLLFRLWPSSSSGWWSVLWAWAAAVAVFAWVYQWFGCEIIEFEPETLVIEKRLLRWSRRREYPIAQCTDLAWHADSEGSGHHGLQCTVGSSTVKFGDYLSEGEAAEVFAALQETLPLVAQQISTATRSHSYFLVSGCKAILDVVQSKVTTRTGVGTGA